MLKLTGDFAKLDHVIAKLDDPGRVLDAVSKNMAEEAIDLVKEGYRTETDPYGKPWVPKQRNDGRKTLSGPTSNLKTGWHVAHAGRDGYTIEPSVEYADYHQNPRRKRDVGGRFAKSKFAGGLKRPRRMQVPDSAKGMPADWEQDLLEAGLEAIEAAYRG